MLLAHQIAEGLEHVGEEGHISSQIQIMIVSEFAALSQSPDLLCPLVVFWLDIIAGEVAFLKQAAGGKAVSSKRSKLLNQLYGNSPFSRSRGRTSSGRSLISARVIGVSPFKFFARVSRLPVRNWQVSLNTSPPREKLRY